MMFFGKIFAVLILILGGSLVYANTKVSRVECYEMVIKSFKDIERVHHIDVQKDILIKKSKESAMGPKLSEESMRGLAILWINGKHLLIELIWWKQTSSDMRRAILFMFYSHYKVEIDNFPSFRDYAKRFKKEEADRRLEEIQEVEEFYNTSRGYSELRDVVRVCKKLKK